MEILECYYTLWLLNSIVVVVLLKAPPSIHKPTSLCCKLAVRRVAYSRDNVSMKVTCNSRSPKIMRTGALKPIFSATLCYSNQGSQAVHKEAFSTGGSLQHRSVSHNILLFLCCCRSSGNSCLLWSSARLFHLPRSKPSSELKSTAESF